jgi:hypothetical protein
MVDDQLQPAGPRPAPKPGRLPNRLPRRACSRRIQVGRDDDIEADRFELLAIDAESAEPHASAAAVEPFGLDKDLKRNALQTGWVAKMIEVSQKILDLEPHHRRLATFDTAISVNSLSGAVHEKAFLDWFLRGDCLEPMQRLSRPISRFFRPRAVS